MITSPNVAHISTQLGTKKPTRKASPRPRRNKQNKRFFLEAKNPKVAFLVLFLRGFGGRASFGFFGSIVGRKKKIARGFPGGLRQNPDFAFSKKVEGHETASTRSLAAN